MPAADNAIRLCHSELWSVRQKSINLRIVPPDSVRSATGELDADAAALLADIAAFDLDAARQRVQEADARASAPRVSATLFPDVARGQAFPDVVVPRGGKLPSPSAPALRSVEASGSAAGGLLDELKDEVAENRRRASDASRQGDAVRARLDRRLRTIFDYCHDLTTQLNYLKPSIPRDYFFMDSDDAFRNLAWVEGFADFRSQAERDGGFIERVALAYTLKGPGERTLERAGGGVERLRQTLFDLGLKFECRERRNSQRELELGTFTVADQIGVQVVWRADFDNNVVIMESRNLERLGYATCMLSPDLISSALLDQFGRLVLGRESRFRALVTR